MILNKRRFTALLLAFMMMVQLLPTPFLGGVAFAGETGGSPESGTYYTVSFKDHNGKTIYDPLILSGTVVSAPTAPSRSGYTFIG